MTKPAEAVSWSPKRELLRPGACAERSEGGARNDIITILGLSGSRVFFISLAFLLPPAPPCFAQGVAFTPNA